MSKPFDLEAALAGHPILLHNGTKIVEATVASTYFDTLYGRVNVQLFIGGNLTTVGLDYVKQFATMKPKTRTITEDFVAYKKYDGKILYRRLDSYNSFDTVWKQRNPIVHEFSTSFEVEE